MSPKLSKLPELLFELVRRALDRLTIFHGNLRSGQRAHTRLTPEVLAEIAITEERRATAIADAAMSPLQRLLTWWGRPFVAGVPDDVLDAFEVRNAIRLPCDFRQYLRFTMPSGNDWDAEGTKWWALEDLKSARQECAGWEGGSGLDGDDKIIVFADYLIWCWAWAIDCSENQSRGNVIMLTGGENPCVAPTFDDFLDRYVQDPQSVM